MRPAARLSRHTTAVCVGLLAALAYIPALVSSPGRMPADTKLYLYFDPARLVGRAASTFESDQFAGWVPHQQITYLWPSGPWYMLFDAIGAPDWIAHRLWIATIMFLAGAGVLWASRLLGVTVLGSLAGAMVYQLSPFLLPYISRTSLLLLPWAGLGWIVALTIRATSTRPDSGTDSDSDRSSGICRRQRLGPWREPALIALVVATVGSANVTTLLMIVPAPVLWIVHVAWQRRITWRQAAGIAARTALLCVGVSTWWMAMSYVQSKHGAPVLDYSETLTDVSRNATGPEVLRSLGYWLFYQRDPFGPTTTESLGYLVSARAIAVSFTVVLVGLAGLALTSWIHRRYAALCAAAGMVLAVGVHPIDSPSPLMRLFVGDGSGLALALRSSTRAVPVFLLGIALGAGALVSAVPVRVRSTTATRHRPDLRPLAALGVAVLAIANLPALWNHAFVDPAIDRDQDPPAAWNAAVERLAATDPEARVLQVPGAEFGAFRWGYTTDPALVGLTRKPLVTRDLLPLGSPGAMDLLFALDDRFQEGTFEPASLAPVSRLLGADTVWLSNDAAFERFRTARPELVDAELTTTPLAAGIGSVERFGEPAANTPDVAMVDPAALTEPAVGRPLSPVTLLSVDDLVSVIRAKTDSVVVSGSGDGLIDAAAVGLLSGQELVRYSGSLDDAELDQALAAARLLIVTDSNRDQAHHWRGSQDVRGHTEPGGPSIDVLDDTSADQRLDVLADDPALQTVAIQVGPVTAIASSYGEPFAYRPEDRAVFAIDADPTTAWTVADHGDPIGERIRLDVVDDGDSDVTSLRVVQAPIATGGRSIASIRVTVGDQPAVDVALDDSSLSADGQEIAIPVARAGDSVKIEITDLVPGRFPMAASFGGVGFSELDLGLGPTHEVIRVPIDATSAVGADTPIALVFTRWRTDDSDPWRSDPEPTLQRRFELANQRSLETIVTLRLDRRAGDELLAQFLAPASSAPERMPIADSRVTGGVAQRGSAAVDGDPATSWVTGFDDAIGATLDIVTSGQLGPNLVIDQPSGDYSTITGIRLDDATGAVDLVVPQPDGSGRSVVALPDGIRGTGRVALTITAIEPRTTIDRRYGDPRTLPAAIAELSATAGIDPVTVDASTAVSADCADGFLTVDGSTVPISFDTTVGALLDGSAVEARSCAPVRLAAGVHELSTAPASPLTVDRVVLIDSPTAASEPGAVNVEVTRDDPRARDVTVAPCPQGCWIVLGEGYNTAWSARVEGESLGSPSSVDGGFNGWWLPANTSPTAIEFRWTAQRPVTMGLAISLVAVVSCALIALLGTRRRFDPLLASPPVFSRRAATRHQAALAAGTLAVASALLIDPVWAAIALLPAAAAGVVAARRTRGIETRVFEMVGLALAAFTAVGVLWIERRDRPFPNAGWTIPFEHLTGLVVFAILSIAVGAMFGPDADREQA